SFVRGGVRNGEGSSQGRRAGSLWVVLEVREKRRRRSEGGSNRQPWQGVDGGERAWRRRVIRRIGTVEALALVAGHPGGSVAGDALGERRQLGDEARSPPQLSPPVAGRRPRPADHRTTPAAPGATGRPARYGYGVDLGGSWDEAMPGEVCAGAVAGGGLGKHYATARRPGKPSTSQAVAGSALAQAPRPAPPQSVRRR